MMSCYVIPGMERADLETIKEVVCQRFGIAPELINTKTRKRVILVPRQVIQTLTRWALEMSLEEVGLRVGNKNHATVLHSIRTTKNQYQTDKVFRAQMDGILSRLNLDYQDKLMQ